MNIRDAVAGDAAPLAALAERTFRDTFAADNSAVHMDAHCAAAYSPQTQARELVDSALRTLVVEAGDGRLVAYAQMKQGPAPACIVGPAPIELWRFYVDHQFHGRGLAQQLMTRIDETAAALRMRTLWLGVWERNFRAQAFYRKCGFAQAGVHTFMLGADAQTDNLMTKEVPHGIT